PVKRVTLKKQSTLVGSIRTTLYEFFSLEEDEGSLLSSLAWFIFEEYSGVSVDWILASCPSCSQGRVVLAKSTMSKTYTWTCTHCTATIYLTDVFRLHEAIDEELGAGGILGYVTTTIEQILLVHLLRAILARKPGLLDHILFIKDGPLAFF